MDIVDARVEVPHGQLFVRCWRVGRDELAPIILLHESLGSVEVWKSFPEALARATQRTVIAYDRLGFGRSSVQRKMLGGGFLEAEGAAHIPRIVEFFGLDEYLVLGHSVGAVMALKVAVANTDCAAVISIAPLVENSASGIASMQSVAERLRSPGQFRRLKRYHAERAEWVLESWVAVWLSPEFAGWQLTGLEDVGCPVLALHGKEDAFFPLEASKLVAERVGGPTRLVRLQAGHVPHLETQDDVIQAIRRFLVEYCVP